MCTKKLAHRIIRWPKNPFVFCFGVVHFICVCVFKHLHLRTHPAPHPPQGAMLTYPHFPPEIVQSGNGISHFIELSLLNKQQLKVLAWSSSAYSLQWNKVSVNENLVVWPATFCVFTQVIHTSLWWDAAVLQRLGGIFTHFRAGSSPCNAVSGTSKKPKETVNKETTAGFCKPR